MSLASQYRQNGKTNIADALERQAQRELEKPAMDVNDINMDSEALRDQYNNPNTPAVMEQPTEVQAVNATPEVNVPQNNGTVKDSNGDIDITGAVNNANMAIAGQNQADSEQYNIAPAMLPKADGSETLPNGYFEPDLGADAEVNPKGDMPTWENPFKFNVNGKKLADDYKAKQKILLDLANKGNVTL